MKHPNLVLLIICVLINSVCIAQYEPFPVNKISAGGGGSVVTNMMNPEQGKFSNRYEVILDNAYEKHIQFIKDKQIGDTFQIKINGKIINPKIHQINPQGTGFIFLEEKVFRYFDLEKRFCGDLYGESSSYAGNEKFYFKQNFLIVAARSVYSRRIQNNISFVRIYNLSDLSKGVYESIIELDKYGLNPIDLFLTNTQELTKIFIRIPNGFVYSYLDHAKKIQDGIIGFSDDFKFAFTNNTIYDLNTMSKIYTFNNFYSIKSIIDNEIKLDYQGQQTHYYNMDRILVFGSYGYSIIEEFASIKPKDEFETQYESEKRIVESKDVIMKKYENMYAEKRKALIRKITESYHQKQFQIENIGTYLPETEEFLVTVNGQSTTIKVPRAEARDFKANYQQARCTGIEQLDESGEKLRVFNVKISNPITGSVYPFGNQLKPLYIDETTIETAESGIPVLDMSAELIEPSGNNLLDGNESALIKVTINNKGTGTAKDVRLNLTLPQIQGLSGEQAQSISGVAAGQSNTVTFKIKTDRNLPTNENLEFNLSATEWKGFNPVPVIINVKSQEFKAPKLEYIEAGITEINGNGNNIIENNEIIEATALIQNKGQGIARNIKAGISINDKNIISVTPDQMNQEIDSLLPGESKSIKFRFTVNNIYNGSDFLPISIILNEYWNEYGGNSSMGLEMKKVTQTAQRIQYDGDYAREVKISEVSLSSDIDKNIPYSSCDSIDRSNKYALIIGNENYSKYQTGLNTESNVDFALNDALTFSKYAENTLCIPKQNITIITDVISSKMKVEIERLCKISEYSGGKAEIIFYYAGHGFPDEKTNDGYIIPVDITGSNVKDGISLTNLYQQLTKNPAKKVTVFLDACFSGGGRNESLLAARGIKIKAKTEPIKGNLVVFTASSGEQSSLPYKEKQHGMFSYFLMKKLQETRGQINYGDLSEYIKKEVQLNSVKINGKDQNPDILTSSEMQDNWRSIRVVD